MADRDRIDLDEIRAIIQLAAEADIAELEVEAAHVKVKVKKTAPVTAAAPSAGGPAHPGAEAAGASPDGSRPAGDGAGRYVPIVAPMVGTFYRAPKPDAPPFVSEGDVVQTGQTVCVLEAMKMFNEIPSEVAGRVVRVLAENGAPVEYGQPLFLVDPRA
ncbi:MAG TPA: acetyl-CoA carboxylase biotin carboxyl carrier protein [bacterium]|nr:acetyl-CoA carboxylase biotin carboxyl carrier protein [bacterium]